MSADLFLGCAVWAYRPWIGEFYPHETKPGQMLERYTERLTCVEGNTTFHAIPSEEIVSRWAEALPPGFKFCPKLTRRVTHEGRLSDNVALTEHFLERMSLLGHNLGPTLVQLPPDFGPGQFRDLEKYLNSWPHDAYPMALEVRHEGWWMDAPGRALNTLLHELGAARVLLDTRPIYSGSDDPQATNPRKKPELPVRPIVTSSFAFVRYIGHPTPERNDKYLAQWVNKVATWLEQGTDVYFFSHCPIEDHSPAQARRFHRDLTERVASLAPLPWNALQDPPKQLGLF